MIAGWGWPTSTARKCHYFPEGEVRSLCGNYGRVIPFPIEADNGKPSPDDCAACRRKLEATQEPAS